MKYLIYPVIILGMSIQLSHASEEQDLAAMEETSRLNNSQIFEIEDIGDENDLTAHEAESVRKILKAFNIEDIGVDNENLIITPEMANQFPVSVLEKMINANEKAIVSNAPSKDETARLEQELIILKQALANY